MEELHQLQSRYLGLGAEINLAAQLRTQYEDARLNVGDHAVKNVDAKIAEQTLKIIELTRQRDALGLYLTIKGALPDEDAWRNPTIPQEALDQARAERAAAQDAKEAIKMGQKDAAPTKKSTRKKAAVKSKTVRVKKE